MGGPKPCLLPPGWLAAAVMIGAEGTREQPPPRAGDPLRLDVQAPAGTDVASPARSCEATNDRTRG